MLAWLVQLSIICRQSAVHSRTVERIKENHPLRVSYQIISGDFGSVQENELIENLIPAAAQFFDQAFKVSSVKEPLSPISQVCGPIIIPESDISSGYNADIIIYLHKSNSIEYFVYGKYCEQETGDIKRPLIGHIAVNPSSFFYLAASMKTLLLIRETAHILALDFDLFKDYSHFDGSRYSDSQYSVKINYPLRGKTVNAIAFPKMLEHARNAFNCEIEGLEFEDDANLVSRAYSSFFWHARIMPQDIMSLSISHDSIFSDITMALFEDSGWYHPNYAYSQVVKWGINAGCPWIEDKCIQDKKINLPGFCDGHFRTNQCDELHLGYGECGINQYISIPPQEAYFDNKNSGGKEIMDYCPVIEVSELNQCRYEGYPANLEAGEIKGYMSRCFTNTLSTASNNKVAQGACYEVLLCTENYIKVMIGKTTIDCPFGSKAKVEGYYGELTCPNTSDFCKNVPCPNMCNGRGKCWLGKCECVSGWGGKDCLIECPINCSSCYSKDHCKDCKEGYLRQGWECVKCSEECKTCTERTDFCTSCFNGIKALYGKCRSSCIEHCDSCDLPCSKCQSSYYSSENKCLPCSENCLECSSNEDNCTACGSDMELIGNACLPKCIEGCVACGNPCKECKSGYLLSSGSCLKCDNICKECSITTSQCTSCFHSYQLVKNTCVQSCKENCQSCDDPCSVCEEGYYPDKGSCSPCSKPCQTCLDHAEKCTSCVLGHSLIGFNCRRDCVENCLTCVAPCEKCADGYYLEQGSCLKCSDNCKTCNYMSFYCTSCKPGFGFVGITCIEACSDHCVTCDTPCTYCENGYYLSNSACIICHESCFSCVGPNSNNCIDCNTGYFHENGNCKKKCQAHCATCDEPCSKCELGYYTKDMGCGKCHNNCLDCTSLDKCVKCDQRFRLVEGSCREGCADHCIECNETCSKCEKRFYLQDTKCLPCSESCIECSSALKCAVCETGYKIENGFCKPDCIDHCNSCYYPCNACEAGYGAVNGRCEKCPEGCSLCSIGLVECFSCISGYTLSSRKCQKTCPLNCFSCDDPCTECEPGYLSVKGACASCTPPCLTCASITTSCTSCLTNYQLEGDLCKPLCPKNCKSCDYPCSECEEGFYSANGACEECSSDCRTCEGSNSFCTSCISGYVLYDFKCAKSCIPFCIDCSYPCLACIEGYRLANGECTICQTYLSSFDVSAKYIKDFSGVSLTFSFPVLEQINDCKSVFKAQTFYMLGSHPLCHWVSDYKFIVMFGKDPEKLLKTLEMFPVASIGIDCSKPASDLAVQIIFDRVHFPLVSISAPSQYTLGCRNDVLIIHGFTEEKDFSFHFETTPNTTLGKDFNDYVFGKVIMIPEDRLEECLIRVSLEVKNFLGLPNMDERFIHVKKVQDLSVYIDVGSYLELSTTQDFTIKGMVTDNLCVFHSKLKFKWTYIPLENELQHIDWIAKDSNLLYIPRGKLKANQVYAFRFSADDSVKNAFTDIMVSVYEGPLQVFIDRSDSSHFINDSLILSAKVSQYSEEESSRFKYSWQCLVDSQPCRSPKGENLLQDTSKNFIEIPPFQLTESKKYFFKVKVIKGDQLGSQSVVITAEQPRGLIKVPQSIESVNIQHDLVVYPEFIHTENYTIKWKQLSGPAVKAISSAEYLAVKKNELLSGRKYEFEVKGSFQNDTIFSKVSWVTNSPPSCGIFSSKVERNSVLLYIECEDGDHADYPLSYIYGVKINSSYVPLRINHSPAITIRLNHGGWTVYVTVCDSQKSCITKENKVQIKEPMTTEPWLIFNKQKVYPENLMVSILNTFEDSSAEFLQRFEELQKYILSQRLKLIHFKMSIEGLEIILRNNKTVLMQTYQNEIVSFLAKVAREIDEIDDDAMYYIVKLFSEHKIKHFDAISKLIAEASEKWLRNAPPHEPLQINLGIKLLRHRFIGFKHSNAYSFGHVNISSMFLPVSEYKVNDLLAVIYPSDPLPIIDLSYYEVGNFYNSTIKLSSKAKKLPSDMIIPYHIDIKSSHKQEFSCLQLRGSFWIDEGCKLIKKNKSTLRLTSWHLSAHKLAEVKSSKIGYSALLTEAAMIVFTILAVALFCLVDRAKSTLIHPYSDYQALKTPKSREPVEFEIVDGEKVAVEKNSTPTYSFEGLRIENIPHILYHPIFNISVSQYGDRRSASVLHFSAVAFAEFAVVGGMFSPALNEVFDEDGKFKKFSDYQLIVLCTGVVFIQCFSGLFMCLNLANDLTITKRYIGMGLSCFIILVSAIVGLVFALSYPALYSFYWSISFIVLLVIEILVFQNVFWVISLKIFRKEDKDNTRNVRVFTTES